MPSPDPLSRVPKPEAVRAELRRHIEREAALRALLKASEAAQRVANFAEPPPDKPREDRR
jgi:hypothetical protein